METLRQFLTNLRMSPSILPIHYQALQSCLDNKTTLPLFKFLQFPNWFLLLSHCDHALPHVVLYTSESTWVDEESDTVFIYLLTFPSLQIWTKPILNSVGNKNE